MPTIDLSNLNLLLIPFASYFIAKLIKIIIRINIKKFDNRDLFDDGGVPSVHSAFVVSVPAAIFFKYWAFNDLFVIAMTLSLIVMYDATRVRYQSGLHASALNKIIKPPHNKLLENIGHTPTEVITGAIIGTIVAFLIIRYL